MQIEKIPPQSVESEYALIAACLIRPEIIPGVMFALQPDDFYKIAHQHIFRALFELKQSSDIVLVWQWLADHKLDQETGKEYLMSVAASASTSVGWKYYADVIKEKAQRRRVLNLCSQSSEQVFGEAEYPLEEIISGLKSGLDNILGRTNLDFIDAAAWLDSDPPEPDNILAETFDAGDKVVIIGSSKLRKSFLLLQMTLSLAAGRNFLTWQIAKSRRVLHVQFEIKAHHFHRRVKRLARALNIAAADLGDRLQIINGRGLGLIGPAGIERIQKAAMTFKPEIIALDPLYKLSVGVENAAEDSKIILNAFDVLAEQTGAAVVFIHHDSKGSPGDRDIRDRGAGSNVLGRDYDACLTMTTHSQDPDATVMEILLRNYRPQEPFVVSWTEDESGNFKFEERRDLMPDKKTSKSKASQPALSFYLPVAEAILGDGEIETASFKTEFKSKTGLSDHRVRDFLTWGQAGGQPYVLSREERGHGVHKKWLRAGRRGNDE